MKYLIIGLLTILFNFSFGNEKRDLELSFEKLSFQKIAASEANKEEIRATGYVTIALKEALGKEEEYESLIVVMIPKMIYISNTNHQLKIENLNIAEFKSIGRVKTVDESEVEKQGKQFLFTGEPLKLEISGTVNRSQINTRLENVEGLYQGTIPLEIHEYEKIK